MHPTKLSRDTEINELLERFGKCGVIEEDDQDEPKFKMNACEGGISVEKLSSLSSRRVWMRLRFDWAMGLQG